MKPVPVRPSSLSERAAYHEAGHCVAAIAYGIPVVSVSIADDNPYLLRGRYHAPHDCGLECIVTLCLAGPASEELFCGRIEDGSDQADIGMARGHLARKFNALQIGAEMARLHDSAQRLVRSTWAQERVRLIADRLLRFGSLSGEDVAALL
jgi:hypothetical protein